MGKVVKTWTLDEIKSLLKHNDEMVIRSLKKLYDCQTIEEKESKHTKYKNGFGFNVVDDKVLTDITEFYIKNDFLTKGQIKFVRSKIMKYSKQLTKIANNLHIIKEKNNEI